MNESSAHRTAHKKPGAFLKALLLHLESEERRQLVDSLAKAEREQRCIRRAVFLALLLFMLSVTGLGYFAILLPEVFRNPIDLRMRTLSVLALGSLISQLGFLAYLLWHRALVIHLHENCRRLILILAQAQLKEPGRPAFAGHLDAPSRLNRHEDRPSTPGAQDSVPPLGAVSRHGIET